MSIRLFVALGAALAVSIGAYAFTAANTVPSSRAGSGSAGVSGYTISGLHFTLNSSAPQRTDSATFTISPVIPSASTGKAIIQVTQGGTAAATYPCTTNTTGESVTCLLGSPVVYAANITSVTIVAAQ
jgi:hypothetical protein